MPAGRPTLYKKEYCEQVFRLCLLGLTDAELAHAFDIEESTLNLWKNAHPEFMESIINGKEKADSEVAEKLWHRAKGYSHPEDKIFLHEGQPVIVSTEKHYPPDTAAAFIWLKNRRGSQWKDKIEVENTGDLNVSIEGFSPDWIAKKTGNSE
ncbi:MAG: terminase [Dehalococcoidia bacterium]